MYLADVIMQIILVGNICTCLNAYTAYMTYVAYYYITYVQYILWRMLVTNTYTMCI